MAKPPVLFHEALFRILRARGLVGERAEKARAAIASYMRALEQAAAAGPHAAALDREMIDDELIELEEKLKQWRLLGAECALVCDATLAIVRRERVENLWNRRNAAVALPIDSARSSQTTG
jgi:hypothetical protein